MILQEIVLETLLLRERREEMFREAQENHLARRITRPKASIRREKRLAVFAREIQLDWSRLVGALRSDSTKGREVPRKGRA